MSVTANPSTTSKTVFIAYYTSFWKSFISKKNIDIYGGSVAYFTWFKSQNILELELHL